MNNVQIHANVPEMLIALLEITKEFAHANQVSLVIHMVWPVLQVIIYFHKFFNLSFIKYIQYHIYLIFKFST